jgi:hypothetical protein
MTVMPTRPPIPQHCTLTPSTYRFPPLECLLATVAQDRVTLSASVAPLVGDISVGAAGGCGIGGVVSKVYVSVIILVVASYCTSMPSDSETNRSGSMVRPDMMTGMTRGFAASTGSVVPLSVAVDLPIHRFSAFSPSVTVTLRVEASQATVPSNASMTARIGTSVRPSTMTGFVPSESIG